jgi:hypothetical protein
MKRSIVGIAVLVLALLAARVALAEQRFTDAAGDSGGAPDITVVNVANDAAGNLTFTATTNQPALAADGVLTLWLDTDRNSSTGGNGVEFSLFVGSAGWRLNRWDGTQFVQASASSANSTYANGVMTFRINKADIGGVSSFVFYLLSVQFNAAGEIVARDDAPDGTAVYDYTLTVPPPPPPPAPPLTLRLSAPVAVQARPAAGKAFAVRVAVTRGDTGGPLASGVATCKVTLGLKPLRAVGSVRAGRASCAMLLPKTAKGKLLRGTIKVTFRNVSATKAFSYRVS